MSPVLTQQTSSWTSSGIARAVSSCQNQALRPGASASCASRGSLTASGSSPAGIRRTGEPQGADPVPAASTFGTARLDRMDEFDAGCAEPTSPSVVTASAQSPRLPHMTLGPAHNASTGNALDRPQPVESAEPTASAAPPAPYAVPFTPPALRAPLHGDPGLLESASDIPQEVLGGAATTFIPLMRAPPSPTHSSAPCSPASSVVLSSGLCRSTVSSATYRLTCSSGADSSTAIAFATNASAASLSVWGAGGAADSSCCPLVNALLGPSEGLRFVAEFGAPPSIQPRTSLPPPQLSPQARRRKQQQQRHLHAGDPKDVASGCNRSGGGAAAAAADVNEAEVEAAASAAATAVGVAGALPSLSHLATASASNCSSRRAALRDQNSVTIKASTVVKDAAGAIDKILSRGVTALVTALRSGAPPYNTAYDSLNQAVKAIAVARQYAKETGPEGAEVTFLPFHRNDSNERADPCRFAFLVFPVPHLDEQLKTVDETVLNVARGSDVHKMASAIIAVMLDRGQAVMKAAGAEAISVAMSAVVNARHRLIQKHGFDLMLAAAWITEDTSSTMGRESKFLRFNVLKTEPAGPKSRVAPSLPAMLEA